MVANATNSHRGDPLKQQIARQDPRIAAWSTFLRAHARVIRELERELQSEQDLALTDYDVLVQLSAADQRRLRMSELADDTVASRSRLSHQINRMERAGLVTRESCDTDKRGAFAVLTARGMAQLEAAAPAHVESVRRVLMDALTPAQFAQLGRLSTKVLAHLSLADGAPGG